MNAALVAVGSELLIAGRTDTNGAWLADRLARIGIATVLRIAVGDDVAAIAAAVRTGLDAADVVLLTGGLGPTEDDRTREAVAIAVGADLERDPEQVEVLRRRFESRRRSFHPTQARQADRPRGSEWLPNPVGSAAGLAARLGGKLVAAMPGVPAEMRAIWERSLEPRLARLPGRAALARRVLKIAGRTESSVDVAVRDLYAAPGLTATILAGIAGIELHLVVTGSDPADAAARLEDLDRAFAERLGDDLFGRDDELLAAVAGARLRAAGLTVATAESCTAGLLAGEITRVPGSSTWFRGGLVVYDDALKVELAGVSPETLASQGAVSEAVARELERGARARCRADVGVGITGIAGPGGGTADKPVGLVHVAVGDGAGVEHHVLRLPGARELVRGWTVTFALDRVRRRAMAAP